jgi:hypothetical protein
VAIEEVSMVLLPSFHTAAGMEYLTQGSFSWACSFKQGSAVAGSHEPRARGRDIRIRTRRC